MKTELIKAREQVANDWKQLAYDIRKENAYASHITEEEKEKYLQKDLVYADEIKQGLHDNKFTIWQRINYVLTGECVSFLK